MQTRHFFLLSLNLILGILFFSSITVTSLFAQELGEDEQDLSVETVDYQGVFFTNAHDGWIVSAVSNGKGRIFNTTDDGDTWDTQYTHDAPLRNIFCTSSSTCLAVGDKGSALKTTDGGSSWTELQVGSQEDLLGGYLLKGGQTLIVIGEHGVIRRSTNGGETWLNVSPDSSLTFTSIRFANSRNGWITTEGDILLKTTNEGAQWQSKKSETTEKLYDLEFVKSDTFFVVGTSGIIRKTSTGGKQWVSQNSDTEWTLRGVDFTNSKHGVTVGDHGVFLATDDGGLTWEALDTGVDATLRDIQCPEQDFCVIVGDQENIFIFNPSTGEVVGNQAEQDQGENAPEQEEQQQSQDLPDLIVTDAVFLSNASVSFKVKNIGTASSPQTFRVHLEWLLDGGSPVPGYSSSFTLTSAQRQEMLAPQGTILFKYPHVGNTVIGEQRTALTEFFSTRFPAAHARTARITVDSQNSIVESDDLNNDVSLPRPEADFFLENLTFNQSNQSAEVTLKNGGPRADGGQTSQVGVRFQWLKADDIPTGNAFDKRVGTIISPANTAGAPVSKPVGTIPADAVKLRATPLFGDRFLVDPDTANDRQEISRP